MVSKVIWNVPAHGEKKNATKKKKKKKKQNQNCSLIISLFPPPPPPPQPLLETRDGANANRPTECRKNNISQRDYRKGDPNDDKKTNSNPILTIVFLLPLQYGANAEDTIPTVGFNMRKVSKGNVTM